MQVILKEDVVGLGDIGQTVNVKPGHARNFLIPQGKALEVSARSGKEIEHQMRHINAKKRQLKGQAEQVAVKMSRVVVEASLRVGSGGKVFGSVSTRDIAGRLKELGYEVDRRRVLLSEPIKKIGTQEVEIKLHADVRTKVKVVVSPLSATAEQEEMEALEIKKRLDDFKSEEQFDDEDSYGEEDEVE